MINCSLACTVELVHHERILTMGLCCAFNSVIINSLVSRRTLICCLVRFEARKVSSSTWGAVVPNDAMSVQSRYKNFGLCPLTFIVCSCTNFSNVFCFETSQSGCLSLLTSSVRGGVCDMVFSQHSSRFSYLVLLLFRVDGSAQSYDRSGAGGSPTRQVLPHRRWRGLMTTCMFCLHWMGTLSVTYMYMFNFMYVYSIGAVL